MFFFFVNFVTQDTRINPQLYIRTQKTLALLQLPTRVQYRHDSGQRVRRRETEAYGDGEVGGRRNETGALRYEGLLSVAG